MICYTLTYRTPDGTENSVQVQGRDEAQAVDQAVFERAVPRSAITNVTLGWSATACAGSNPQIDAQIDRWHAQGQALGLKTLSLSMDGFDPDMRLCPAKGIDTIRVTNGGGGRFETFTAPVDITLGQRARRIDEEMSGWNGSAFLEQIDTVPTNDSALLVRVFIGS